MINKISERMITLSILLGDRQSNNSATEPSFSREAFKLSRFGYSRSSIVKRQCHDVLLRVGTLAEPDRHSTKNAVEDQGFRTHVILLISLALTGCVHMHYEGH